jgi:hypothetical protein
METDGFINHLEKYLGQINCGWNKFPEGETWKFQVIELTKGIFQNINAYCTLGLSNDELDSRVSDKKISHELMMMVPDNFGSRNIPAVLHEISEYLLDNNKPLLRGDVCDFFSGPVFKDLNFTSFYVAPPVCLPDEFAYYKFSDKKTIIICWLVPLYYHENIFIKEYGWQAFEDKAEESQVDFFNLNRDSFLTPLK